MKKLRKIIALILALSLLAGCSANGLNIPFIAPKEREMTKVDLSEFGRVDVFSIACNEKYIAFLYSDMPELTGEEIIDGGYGEEYEEENTSQDGGMVGSEGDAPTIEDEEAASYSDIYKVHLGVYDIERDRLVDTKVVDTYAYTLAVNEDNIQLWLNNEGKITSELYSMSLEKVGNGKGKPVDRHERPKDSDADLSERFPFTDSVFYQTNSAGYLMLIFPDDRGNYIMKKSGDVEPVEAAYKKLVLERSYTDPDTKDEIIFSVNDYENGKCINTLKIDNSKTDYSRVSNVSIDGKYVLYAAINPDFSTESICCWNYNFNAENKALEYDILSEATYDATVERITKELKDEYNVEFVMTPECKPEEHNFFEYDWTNELTLPEYFLNLYDIEYFFSTLPKELYTQMLCKDIENPVASFEKQYIYLVGDFIDDSLGAYASNLEGDLYIVYSCNDFCYSTFCHELMHNMEYRIWNYYKDFDSDWLALNPDGFDYDYEDYVSDYYDNEPYQDYFMRDYSTKSILEDKATIFEQICEAALFDNEKWWEDKKPLNKKVHLLKKAITDSYPFANEINGIRYVG